MKELDEIVKNWLIKANNDLKNAEIVVLTENPPTDTIIFHCQQAVEKYLKAYLILNNIEFKKTHDLEVLYNNCLSINKNFNLLIDNIIKINSYGVEIRYPDNFYIPGIEESKEVFDMTLRIIKTIK